MQTTPRASPAASLASLRRAAYREGQEDQLAALGLVLNAVALRNTRYLDAIVEHLRGSGQPVRDEDVARLSRSGTRTSTASAATPSPPSRQQSYDRCATRTHAIARTTASSDVTVRGSFCGTGGIALRWLYVRRGARRPSEAVMRSRARSGASRRIARVRSAQPVPRRARSRPR